MNGNYNDKRKHYRFPAFDDDTGVKLRSGRTRVLFEEEDFLNAAPVQTRDYSDSNQFEKKTWQKPAESSRQSPVKQSAYDSVEFADLPQKETWVEKPLEKLHRHPSSILTRKDYHSAYGNQPNVKQPAYSSSVRHSDVPRRTSSFSSADVRRSHFVPKHIPASSYVTNQKNTDSVDRKELMRSMQHGLTDYLLFDSDNEAIPTAVQPKETASLEIPIQAEQTVEPTAKSRTELKKRRNRKFDSFDDYDEVLAKARTQITQKKEETVTQTPYEQKSEETKRKNSRLEKTLGGLMEDEGAQLENSSYFDV